MKNRTKSKKAQLAIPFHWIFILIAGALILIFFISIVFKQKAVSEEKLSAELISSIEEIFTGAGVGEDETIHVIDIPKTEFNFICEEESGISEYSIKGTGVPRQTPTEIMFSPDLVKGKELIIWSMPWSMPFKITNFIMISSSDVRYIIFHSQAEADFAQQVKTDMPDPLTVDLVTNINQIPDTGNYKIKFIFIGIDPTTVDLSILKDKPNKAVSAVRIGSDHVVFYEKQFNIFVQQEKGTVIYLPAYNEKDAIYFAAMYAENAEQYRCNLKKILKRLNFVSEIYKDRTLRLQGNYNPNNPGDICGKLYAVDGFSRLNSVAQDCFDDLDSHLCNYQEFFTAIEGNLGIRERNMRLQENGCLLIY
ncbi:hypothetical protein KY343_00665 [Candidatus Woesearchaeota archaeon]|nr:hypothetical protein [Candidatus Woesearchaeota archaeon]